MLLPAAQKGRGSVTQTIELDERKGVFDIKHRGLQPIESLARWAGLASGVSAASTRARLEAAEAAGVFDSADSAVLRDVY